MSSIVLDYKSEFQKAVDFFKTDISGLRTGRANAAIVENIMVEAYGGQMPVKGLANIAIPERLWLSRGTNPLLKI